MDKQQCVRVGANDLYIMETVITPKNVFSISLSGFGGLTFVQPLG